MPRTMNTALSFLALVLIVAGIALLTAAVNGGRWFAAAGVLTLGLALASCILAWRRK